ncbi:hypothetical protein CHARACLAT_005793 [Characodon lateralis]|uniref:Uncharacterized protein n=1 Tax=Characodon lateralis TaxID=208331 RepID=A0ABU7DZJ2_9TELE|nr:hypothetical protein [Characodon lateralis]
MLWWRPVLSWLSHLINRVISDAEWEDMLEGFDERSYLNARRWKPGDDPYTLYAFNQRESERIPSDRALRDTRHYRHFLLSENILSFMFTDVYIEVNKQHRRNLTAWRGNPLGVVWVIC